MNRSPAFFISLNLFPLPTSLFQIEIAQQADGSGIYMLGKPADGYVHFQEEDDRDNENQVTGQGYHLHQEGGTGVARAGYGLEEDESRTLEKIAGAEYPERGDGGFYQVGHVGIDAEHIRRQTGYQQDDGPDNAGAEPYVLSDGGHDVARFSAANQVADQGTAGGGKGCDGHERDA